LISANLFPLFGSTAFYFFFGGNWIKFEMGGIVTFAGRPRATLSAGKAGISTRVNILLSGRVFCGFAHFLFE
jgi:hypothetical protein